jgi:hypothetical protein
MVRKGVPYLGIPQGRLGIPLEYLGIPILMEFQMIFQIPSA